MLVTGHTGFKGSWLSLWLKMLGAELYGISLSIPTNPSHFENLKIKFKQDIRLNISKTDEVKKIIKNISPDFIFHLAAQPIVSDSFVDPINTFLSNTIGTANILDSLKELKTKCVVVLITSDKAYDNLEIKRGYHENDKLGGADPYSASKGAAELIISSYIRSYFSNDNYIKIGVGRAGNVIGGGDWAKNRIIPDVVRSVISNDTLIVRSPNATRPWQHVLEPISGYLSLAIELYENDKSHGEAFNFGPFFNEDYKVSQVLDELKKTFKNLNWKVVTSTSFKESTLLKLDCSKALEKLDWKSTLSFKETIDFTSSWYLNFLQNQDKIHLFSESQIYEYIEIAKTKKIKWTQA